MRITIWLLVLAVLGAAIYVNQIGLPGFVKKPLLEKLRARGIELQFSRLRLSWYGGIVAENVRFGADEPLSPAMTIGQVQVELNHQALKHFQLQVDALRLRKGRLIWPISETNQAARQLTVDNIKSELRFLPGDQWQLDQFTAAFSGANIQLSGSITNASAVRQWKFFHGETPTPGAATWQNHLRSLADALDQIHFPAPPDLRLDIRGDANNPLALRVRLSCFAAGAETPWGDFEQGKLVVHVGPSETNSTARGDLTLDAALAQTKWACATNLQLTLQLATVPDATNLIQANLSVTAAAASSPWGAATNAHLSAQWVHSLTNPVPLFGDAQLACSQPYNTNYGSAGALALSWHFATAEPPPSPADGQLWGWWANLQPYLINWQCRVQDLRSNVRSMNVEADDLRAQGDWKAPLLTLTNIEARLYSGNLRTSAALNVATRALHASVSTDIDAQKAKHLLTQNALRFLSQFAWNTAPAIDANVSLVLPPWTNQQPDWRGEVLPTLMLDGRFNVTNGGAFRGMSFKSARSHFAFSNLTWHLPDIVADRPEGVLHLSHESNEQTREFFFGGSSTLAPDAARPLLSTNETRVLDFFSLTQPPVLDFQVRGRWGVPESIALSGHAALTNFTFRGEKIDSLQTAFAFSNKTMVLVSPALAHEATRCTADGLTLDFNVFKLYLTNGVGNADPLYVARPIGPHVIRALEPYHFSRPPTAFVHGTIPLLHEEDADLFVHVRGGPFAWWKFHVADIEADVHWAGTRLTLSDVKTEFYGGRALGSAAFNFVPTNGPGLEYHFDFTTKNTRLEWLMADLAGRTNNPEGALSGHLAVTHANPDDLHSTQGHAEVQLHDGLIWAIPIFGALSPALDSLVPGLGSTRASEGNGKFVITNGIIRSDDLEIRSPAMRLKYRGGIDLDGGRVNAKLEAELLRDMYVVGPVLSTVLWPITKLFEYKVTGSLSNPKLDSVYFIPKIVLMPFHPFKTIRGLFPEEQPPSPPGTFAPIPESPSQ
ncbi:MAG TPA: AsmA-like C-terminal region-containing protein [Candidatus Dormibacteraeota bacterium]|nr:AsmA-like C-terminal region-containing protein [Candidatus Dormibacteraeota bacterium]